MVGEGPASGAVSPPMRPMSMTTAEAVFRANLPLIAEVIRLVANHHRLPADERDEFGSEVHLKLIENDYEVFRRFEHRAKLKTYLVTVIERQYLDFRNKNWGKWRPSAEARRLGPVAVRLEQLVTRDGLTLDEAVSTLLMNHQVGLSRDELYALFHRLPPRTPRRFVEEEAGEHVRSDAATTEEELLAREQAEARRRAERELNAILQTLPAQDRLIIKFRYTDSLKIVTIARLMGLEQKYLYRHVEQLRETLRAALEARGITAADVLGTDAPEDSDDGDT